MILDIEKAYKQGKFKAVYGGKGTYFIYLNGGKTYLTVAEKNIALKLGATNKILTS